MKSAVEHTFTGDTVLISSYDHTKTNLGTIIQQRTGATADDKFAGPMPIGMARPMEASTATTAGLMHIVPWSSDVDWIFLADNSTAALTRRIAFYEYTKSTSTFNWKGAIVLNFVTNTGNKTIRGIRAVRTTHISGTVAVSGTAVTGSSSSFQTDRIAAGARIGFGSTDPTQISTWYNIASIASDTSLTLGSSAGTIGSGTAYVIEEVRIVLAITNATPANGGLFVVKGLNYSTFTPASPNIAEASTADNIQGIYWLADASTVTNTVAAGIGLDDTNSTTQQYCWVLNGTTTAQIFKYNLRASLGSLTAGKSTSSFVFATGVSGTLTGTSSQLNNGRIITAGHGPGSGVKSFYFATTTRIYRCAESGINNGVTNFLTDNMVEIPPGSASTYASTAAMQSIDFADSIDRFIIMTSGSGGLRSYVTKYNTVSDTFDHIFLNDDKQLDQSLSDSGGTAHPAISALSFAAWSEAGILYLQRLSTAIATNQLYAMPLSSHWTYAQDTEQLLITPLLTTTNAVRFYRVYINYKRMLGDNTFGIAPEPFRLYYRTAGITDNSGTWTLVGDNGDLTGTTAANGIQFMFEFRALGLSCIPARVYGVVVTYEDSSTDSHYNPSATKSNAASRIFAWRQATSWGGTIPDLTVKVYNAATNALILTDTVSGSISGTWQYSSDGTSWSSWSAAADSVGNYIRYTADSLPDGISVRVVVTQ